MAAMPFVCPAFTSRIWTLRFERIMAMDAEQQVTALDDLFAPVTA